MNRCRRNILYRIAKVYAVFMYRLYYPKIYVLGAENIPAPEHPNVMVACHQNCLIDGLAPFFALTDRKMYGMARSGAFKGGAVSWFMRRLGLLPISRMDFEGEDEMRRFNDDTLRRSIDTLARGNTLLLFPEAGHQDKRWLGYFSLMYVRLAFDVAKRCNYQRQVFITPYAHHYGHYHHPFYSMMMMFGKPIDISPYYERYQQKPRTCQREITAIIEQRISEMMLDIRDIDNYRAIDYLRQSRFGRDFCLTNGLAPGCLPDKLQADKLLAESLAALPDHERAEIFRRAADVAASLQRYGLRDWLFEVSRPVPLMFLMLLSLLSLAIPALVALMLTLPIFAVPFILKRIPINGAVDRMFDSTYDYAATTAVTFPLTALLPLAPLAILVGWWALLWPPLCLVMMLFVCFYQRLWVKTAGLWRLCVSRTSQARDIRRGRETLFAVLNKCLKENL